jgi:hypothetical protein
VRFEKGLQARLDGLSPNDPEIKLVEEIAPVLHENMFAGESIRKRQSPSHYIKMFGVNNLFRYHLPRGFRAIYTLERDGNDVSVVVLEILDHKNYEERFGY